MYVLVIILSIYSVNLSLTSISGKYSVFGHKMEFFGTFYAKLALSYYLAWSGSRFAYVRNVLSKEKGVR
jgi:hypothetical protein